MSLILSSQEIRSRIVVISDTQTLEIPLPVQDYTLKTGTLQGIVEVRRAAHILIGIDAVVTVRLVQRRRTLLIAFADVAFVLKEVSQPVILAAVFVDGLLYALRYRDPVFQLNDLLRTLDDPGEYALASVVIQVLAVILDVALAGDLGAERDHDQPAPDTVI